MREEELQEKKWKKVLLIFMKKYISIKFDYQNLMRSDLIFRISKHELIFKLVLFIMMHIA